MNVLLKFNVSGDIEDLKTFALNTNKKIDTKLENGIYKGKHESSLQSGETLKIKFELSGMNGTDYKIEYDCKADGAKKEDPAKESPIEDAIETNGYKEEIINIKM